MTQPTYPYIDGDVVVLGPEVFATPDSKVISWKGQNYVTTGSRSRIQQVQEESSEWRNRNFPDHTLDQCLFGVMEELGELCHAKLKSDQSIRSYALSQSGAPAEEIDAIGDMVIFLMGFCTARGYDFEECVTKTWEQVKLRNWQKNPEDGSA